MSKRADDIDNFLMALRNPHLIRRQAHRLLQLAKDNQLKHFTFHPEKMTSTVAFVVDVITSQYPELDIPYHSRWRHFEVGGVDRITSLKQGIGVISPMDYGKILYELVIISVFLDAGAGSLWRYKDNLTDKEFSRSEGLALASLSMYQHGAFSNDPLNPLRVDAQRLIDFNENDLRQGFQVTATNPLEGVAGRAALFNQLGQIIKNNPLYFGTNGRLGDFYSYISSLAVDNHLSAVTLFQAVLAALNDTWPTRLVFAGVSLGDVWIHEALKNNQPGAEYIPFHKLSQWLTYSLIEPLEQAGIKVTNLDELTGLPEYRNGGLLIDMGLLEVKNPELLTTPQEPGSEVIIEWRALTVALLDELAILIRQQLHKEADSLPLAKILQGGTWEAGRRIAKQKREHGTPPIQIISDGTVF